MYATNAKWARCVQGARVRVYVDIIHSTCLSEDGLMYNKRSTRTEGRKRVEQKMQKRNRIDTSMARRTCNMHMTSSIPPTLPCSCRHVKAMSYAIPQQQRQHVTVMSSCRQSSFITIDWRWHTRTRSQKCTTTAEKSYIYITIRCTALRAHRRAKISTSHHEHRLPFSPSSDRSVQQAGR